MIATAAFVAAEFEHPGQGAGRKGTEGGRGRVQGRVARDWAGFPVEKGVEAFVGFDAVKFSSFGLGPGDAPHSISGPAIRTLI